MCRIAGIINHGFPIEQLEGMVASMCDCMKHGGPDDGGIFFDRDYKVVLGNRRLALQDLSSAGHQPMHYQSRYTITYNGELYNFLSLKEQLITLGHTFKNHTDTEVILASFAEWHTGAFSKFNGMYAFALYDELEHELYLVRDAAGMKPLYYSTASDGLCFASEIRALKHVSFLGEEEPNWPVYLMAYGHLPEPVTTLKEVKPLHKGCFLKYNVKDGSSSMQSYSFYSYTSDITNRDAAIAGVSGIINAAVKRHLISDASIGVFLSGGLDSSIIATVASEVGSTKLNTFSLYFKEEDFSEKQFQDLVIGNIETNAFQHLLSSEEFNDSMPAILSDMDMPGCDGINTWFISKYAREAGLKAVLSGIGGDELFGGYPSFSRMKLALALQKMPGLLKEGGSYISLKQAKRLPYLEIKDIRGLYLFLRGHFVPKEIARHLGSTEKEVWNILNDLPVFNPVNLDPGNMAGWMEFNTYMQNQLLRDADVMGMAHGVEIRLPFLDREMISFANSISPLLKYSGIYNKQLLVDCFKDKLPHEIWARPKMGFGFPFKEWLGKNSFIEQSFMEGDNSRKEAYKQFVSGKMHWSHLFSLLQIDLRKSRLQLQ